MPKSEVLGLLFFYSFRFRETQQATSDSIMTSVQTTMASYPYNFTANQATIISGSEEGTYGWVSTNFLAGTLNVSSGFFLDGILMLSSCLDLLDIQSELKFLLKSTRLQGL